jgi:hypothetical protein
MRRPNVRISGVAAPRKCTLRIVERPDERFETRNANPGDSPLGVDTSRDQAIGSARREAMAISRAENCRVSIKMQQGRQWKEVDHVEPPR